VRLSQQALPDLPVRCGTSAIVGLALPGVQMVGVPGSLVGLGARGGGVSGGAAASELEPQ
jgi:hypothetical protein